MRTPDSNIVVIHVKLMWGMNRWIILILIMVITVLVTPQLNVYSSNICKKCVDRDFSLYTVGYEFKSGDEITVRLFNIGDRGYEVNYLDLYMVYSDNESVYLGRYEVNSVIDVGSYYEFTIEAPDVDEETTVHLVAFLGTGDKTVSNELVIRPSSMLTLDLSSIDEVLTLAAIILIGYITYRYYYRG